LADADLVWHAPLRGASGYGDEARTFLLALERSGHPAAAQCVAWDGEAVELPAHQAAALARAYGRRRALGHTLVHHLQPSTQHGLNEDGVTVARTMYETDRIPAHWPIPLLEVDEIWVPCTFNLETFERGGVPRERLHVLPETIDFDLFDPADIEPLDLAAHGFTFLTSFDFTDRKGWDVLLDAWADAFGPHDGVSLVLKCVSHHGLTERDIEERVAAYLDGRRTAPIVVNTELLPGAELPRLYAAADAFVLASRGEGWGRPYMEAMAMGLPTIGSRWSGNVDFMHDGNSLLVDGTVVPVVEWKPLPPELWRGHRWFEPDRDALAAALREVAANGPAVQAKAASARAELVERFGPEPVAARIRELADGAVERRSERLARPLAAVWRGQWGSSHSLAVVNDAHARRLEEDGGRIERVAPGSRPVAAPVVGVTSSWPPRFEQLSAGPLVLYQPWEFGEIPTAWVDEIRRGVDEVWAPSEHARNAYLASGIAPELVHVVPNGVDLDRFRPDGPRRALPTGKGTVFLFVGGTVYRKGIDVLLTAFARAFTAADDVALVVKANSGESFYRGQTADDALARFDSLPDAPELVVMDDDLPADQVPALYRAADVLVQPYRGEGFCLPVLEALACGVPVVATAGGPTDDFVSDACAWRIPSRRAPLPASELVLTGDGWLLEPDVDALVDLLREAADPDARADRAAAARSHAERWSWDAAAAAARARIAALTGCTPIRRHAPALVPNRRRTLFAASPDWDAPETWEPVVRAYAEAFEHDADTTLVLPAADEGRAVALVTSALERAELDPGRLADVVVADASGVSGPALELASDAFVHAAGPRPRRARRVLPPEPAALRAVAAR
jgi:glycosyltransferase involved in cell wall biosynthesis